MRRDDGGWGGDVMIEDIACLCMISSLGGLIGGFRKIVETVVC